jgi:VanZ family protein
MKPRVTSFALVVAWIAVLAVAYATLVHVGLIYSIYFKVAPFVMHPDMQTYGHFVHIIAFGFLGVVFSLAYPKRPLLVGCIVLGGAALLELAQTLTPDRHGTLVDALEKIAGGGAGVALVKAIDKLR